MAGSNVFRSIYNLLKLLTFLNSRTYWSERYSKGGDSGQGSYGRLAEFKANVLNGFVQEHGLESVVELGCGDGNQLGLFNFPAYRGLDITAEAVARCEARYRGRDDLRFGLYRPEQFAEQWRDWQADVALSLDVIYHLVEDSVYETYLDHLFHLGRRYVVIYSSNFSSNRYLRFRHVRHRKFTDDVATRFPDWQLVQHIPNAYPKSRYGRAGAPADFYVYRRSA